jgi:hypothetical protein
MNPVCIGLEVIVLGARFCLGEPQVSHTVTIPVCAVTVPRDRDFQHRLADELRAGPQGSATESAISEWISLRDQVRACRAVR